ncbi:leucine rich adaptor protein 1-like [Arapaima gigas]
MTDEARAGEPALDLKELETKTGCKIPAGLLAGLREEHAPATPTPTAADTGTGALAVKMKGLKEDMASLRSTDVKILRQLLAVHEGIESVRWLLEERGALTSRCSSLTSSQYSLTECPDTSLRGSWSSLPDPGDRLDNISVGSYLDTLADDLDEYCAPGSNPVLCSTPMGPEVTGRVEPSIGCSLICSENSKEELQAVPKLVVETPQATETRWRSSLIPRDSTQAHKSKSNGFQDEAGQHSSFHDSAHTCQTEKLSNSLSSRSKSFQNSMIESEGCKLSGRKNLEYDSHYHWVQSQNDVTFL